MTKEWNEYLEILSEMKTTKHVQDAYKKLGDDFMNDMLGGPQPNTAPYTRPRPPRGKSGLGPLEEDVPLIPEIKEDLNRDIWDENDKLKPEIAEKLLKIARDFYEGLDLAAPILDITITGSIANYNWTEKSDIDLHILIDYAAVNEDIELVKKYLSEAKTNWNKNHEIMIKDHEVEVYVQDNNEPHHSTGVYSILNDEWIIKPERAEFQVSEDDVKKKNQYFIDAIDSIQKTKEDGKYEEAYGDSDRLTDKLRIYRQSGLETGGEFSVENLVFKTLRNSDYIGKLYDIKRGAYDAIMSVEQ
jgi:predicted nucleotidyltransferase